MFTFFRSRLHVVSLLNTVIVLCFQDEPMDTDQSSTFLSSIQSEIAKYQLLIDEENQKLKRYKVGLWPAQRSLQPHAVIM